MPAFFDLVIFRYMTTTPQAQTQTQTKASITQPMLQVKIKKWHTVAEWKWDVNDDSCGICRMPFDSYCVDCKLPGDDCPLGIIYKFIKLK